VAGNLIWPGNYRQINQKQFAVLLMRPLVTTRVNIGLKPLSPCNHYGHDRYRQQGYLFRKPIKPLIFIQI
jgi:hypothetical protein